MSTETDNINHELLRKLAPLGTRDKETLSETEKRDLHIKLALSQPNNQAGQGYLGPMAANQELQGDYRSEGAKKEQLPLHEPETDETPEESEQFYREVNGLDYPIYPNTGIVRKRQDVQYFPQIDQYTATLTHQPIIEIQLNTNYGQYVCGKNSYLKLRVTPSTNEVYFGSGSACNVIRRARYVLANGEVLDNCDNVNIYNHIRDNWSRGTDYVLNYGQVKGYQQTEGPINENELIIPLGDILPVFNVESLLPPEMINRCTITLQLEKPVVAFERHTVTPTTYEELEYKIDDISIIMDSYFIDTHYVNLMHTKEILIEYPTYESIVYNDEGNAFNFDLEISKSRVINVICRPQLYENDDQYFEYDSMDGQFLINQNPNKLFHSWKVGNQKYPEYKQNKFDEYIYNYKTFGANITESLLKPDDDEAFGVHYIETLNLERSKYNIEGQPITNKNIIKYSRVNEAGIYENVNFIFFITYMKRVQVKPLTPEQNALLQFPDYDITD